MSILNRIMLNLIWNVIYIVTTQSFKSLGAEQTKVETKTTFCRNKTNKNKAKFCRNKTVSFDESKHDI